MLYFLFESGYLLFQYLNKYMDTYLFIFGTGGHAKVIFDLAEKTQLYTHIKFVSPENIIREFLGKEVIFEEIFLSEFDSVPVVLAIGDNVLRKKVLSRILSQKKDFSFPSLIHNNATIANNVNIGVGSIVMAGAIINIDTNVGNFTIINTNAVVEHDSKIGDFSHIAPNATLCGGCSVGDNSLIGASSTIIEGLTIGDSSIVAAGATVINSVPDRMLSKGVPAISWPIN